VRTGAEYLALRVVMGLLGALPLSLALRLGELGALLAYALDVSHRRVGMANLGVAFPERPLRERRWILRRSFLNLGYMAAELAHLPRLSDERLRDMVRFEDEAWWQQAVGWERSTGVLVLSGHFGNWELLVFAHGRRGYPVHMVHRALANPLVDRWLCELRRRAGTRMIRKSVGAGGVLQALHEHGLLVLPIDQNSTRGPGLFVDFFWMPASTNGRMARNDPRPAAPPPQPPPPPAPRPGRRQPGTPGPPGPPRPCDRPGGGPAPAARPRAGGGPPGGGPAAGRPDAGAHRAQAPRGTGPGPHPAPRRAGHSTCAPGAADRRARGCPLANPYPVGVRSGPETWACAAREERQPASRGRTRA